MENMTGKSYNEQKTSVIIGDKDGKIASHFVKEGKKVYAYHPTHDDMEVSYNPTSRGLLLKSGEPMDIFLAIVKAGLKDERLESLHINKINPKDLLTLERSGISQLADTITRRF